MGCYGGLLKASTMLCFFLIVNLISGSMVESRLGLGQEKCYSISRCVAAKRFQFPHRHADKP